MAPLLYSRGPAFSDHGVVMGLVSHLGKDGTVGLWAAKESDMLREMRELVEFFGPHVRDTETLERLLRMIDDRGSWSKAHHLFDHIRHKTLRAQRGKDIQAEAQFLFEEACAKTLFNFTHSTAPFDSDSPYWIVPNALTYAKKLGIDPMDVVRIVTSLD